MKVIENKFFFYKVNVLNISKNYYELARVQKICLYMQFSKIYNKQSLKLQLLKSLGFLKVLLEKNFKLHVYKSKNSSTFLKLQTGDVVACSVFCYKKKLNYLLVNLLSEIHLKKKINFFVKKVFVNTFVINFRDILEFKKAEFFFDFFGGIHNFNIHFIFKNHIIDFNCLDLVALYGFNINTN